MEEAEDWFLFGQGLTIVNFSLCKNFSGMRKEEPTTAPSFD
jgi:hypothetical protein